jgi:hypothetical protein
LATNRYLWHSTTTRTVLELTQAARQALEAYTHSIIDTPVPTGLAHGSEKEINTSWDSCRDFQVRAYIAFRSHSPRVPEMIRAAFRTFDGSGAALILGV